MHAQGIDSSLRSLGVEALDLVQFYWHDYSVPRYVGAAQRLQVWLEPVLASACYGGNSTSCFRKQMASVAQAMFRAAVVYAAQVALSAPSQQGRRSRQWLMPNP
jgi:hypothetical protein